MTTDDLFVLRQQLMRDEGLRLLPYADTRGVITIGYGTNITDGITEAEARLLLDSRMTSRIEDLTRAWPFILTLDPVRQIVLANMCYNLGLSRQAKFRNMWAALRNSDWDGASREMLASDWEQHVGKRAHRLAEAMRTGAWT